MLSVSLYSKITPLRGNQNVDSPRRESRAPLIVFNIDASDHTLRMTTHLGSARRTRLLRDERLQHELCSSPAHPAAPPPPAPAPRRCDSGPRAWGPERERVVLTPPIRSPISYHAIGYDRSILLTCTFHSLKFQFQLSRLPSINSQFTTQGKSNAQKDSRIPDRRTHGYHYTLEDPWTPGPPRCLVVVPQPYTRPAAGPGLSLAPPGRLKLLTLSASLIRRASSSRRHPLSTVHTQAVVCVHRL